jgi:hypothetical protein
MAIRFAITVAGAVSLGSYEAGVLYEILDALAQHNAGIPDDQKNLVDVLTGPLCGWDERDRPRISEEEGFEPMALPTLQELLVSCDLGPRARVSAFGLSLSRSR